MPNALSTTLGKTLTNLLRIHPGTSNFIITLKERNLSVHLRKSVVIKRLIVSWIVRIVIKRWVVFWRILNTRVRDPKV